MNRKTLIMLFLPALAPLALPAQPALRRDLNAPRAGDEIIRRQVEYRDPGRSGDSVLWDFSRLASVSEEYALTYSCPALTGSSVYIMGKDTIPASSVRDGELLIGEEHSTMYYYRLNDSRLWILGHENPTNLLQYTTPLLRCAYPLSFGDSLREDYASRGVYSSDRPFSVSGSVEITADARGMMLLPSGDTLKQVLRVKTLQAIRENDSPEAKAMLENNSWYACGYRYPVFETVMTDAFATAFFYPPQDHYYLDADEASLALRDSDTIEKPASPWSGLNYNLYPNPAVSHVNIDLYLPKAANVRLRLRAPSGALLLGESLGPQPEGLLRHRLDLPALPPGSYVLTILLDDCPVSEILMKR